MAVCHYCGTQIEEPRSVTRYSTCVGCGKDLRVCLNCKFYDPSAHWQCREEIPEEVRDKERANFCDYFMLPPDDSAYTGSKKQDKSDEARDKFRNLFGDP